MRVPRAAVRLLMVALVCLGAAPRAVAGPGPGVAIDVPLRPLAQPAIAELLAYTCVAALQCAGGECAVHTSQRYQLALPEGAAAATLRVGLPAEALDRRTALTDVELRDEQGTALPITSPEADLHAVWEIPMERGQRRTLELTYRHPATADPFVIWSWEAAALSAWGTVTAVHGEFVLPVPTDDDALVRVSPHRANLLGERLWWDYERASEYPPHHVVAISPPAWERLLAWRAQGAHREVASLLGDLHEGARAEGIPEIEYSAEIIAELLAALEAGPTDTAARADLASAYLTLAEETAGQRLNYLLLAARELSVAREQPGHTAGPSAEELSIALGRTYLQAAHAASAAGDPAGALEYLRLAREAAGSQLADELAGADELTLRWALRLAELGRVSEALAELDGLLAPGKHEGLLRYAPPLVAARTEVSLRPSARTVRYSLEPYPPVAAQVRERLDDVVRRLQQTPCCEVSLEEGGVDLTLTVRAPAGDAALEACRRDIAASLAGEGPASAASGQTPSLAAEQDLVTAIIAQPWRAVPTIHAGESGLWCTHLRYAEGVDAGTLDEVWRAGSEYADWRLVELHNAPAADTRAQLEHQLALAVIREQRQAWEALPSAGQWQYEVAFDDAAPPVATWLVAWGQQRELAVDLTIPHWGTIRAAALLAAALLAAPLLVRRLWRGLARTHN